MATRWRNENITGTLEIGRNYIGKCLENLGIFFRKLNMKYILDTDGVFDTLKIQWLSFEYVFFDS